MTISPYGNDDAANAVTRSPVTTTMMKLDSEARLRCEARCSLHERVQRQKPVISCCFF